MGILDTTGVDVRVQDMLARAAESAPGGGNAPKGTGGYLSPERLFLTADGRAVNENDPDAAFLLCPAGGCLPQSLADELQLGQADLPLAPPSVASKPAVVKTGLVITADNSKTDGGGDQSSAPLV